MSRKYSGAVSNRKRKKGKKISATLCRYSASARLLEVAAKHISKTTAITSVQWHAIYIALPGEINFVVTTHKINNSERNSGHSSAVRNSIITGHELQRSLSPAEECSLSLDYLYHFICGGAFFPIIRIYVEHVNLHIRTKNLTLELKDFQGFSK